MRWGGEDGKGATVISNVAVCNSRIEGYELTKFFHAWWNDPRRTSRFIFLDREEWRGSFDDWKGKKKVFQVPPGWNKNVLKTVTLRFPKQKIFRAKELLHFHGWRANCDSIKRAPFPVEFQRNHALKKSTKKEEEEEDGELETGPEIKRRRRYATRCDDYMAGEQVDHCAASINFQRGIEGIGFYLPFLRRGS